MKLELQDTVTGNTAIADEPDLRPFDWAVNNWSCDCNRGRYFGHYDGEGCCQGPHNTLRYRVVRVLDWHGEAEIPISEFND